MTAPALVPLAEACELLGIDRRTAGRLIRVSAATGAPALAPGLPVFKLGGWKVTRVQLDRFLKQGPARAAS